jgi:hypothetical protein
MKDVKEIVKAVEQATSDTEAIDAIEQKRQELAIAGPPPQRVTLPSELRQARMYLGGLTKLTENPAALLDLVDDETKGKSIAQWTEVRELAEQVLRLYNQQP